MGLRNKVLCVMAITAVACLVINQIITRDILLQGFRQAESSDARINMHRAIDGIKGMIATMHARSYDWAVWDDAWKYMQDGNEEFTKANLTDVSIRGMKLNLMMLVMPDGGLRFGRAIDGGNAGPPPPSILSLVKPATPLVAHHEPLDSISGIVMTDGRPLLVSSRPIIQSNERGPIRGTLIFGRYLDESLVQEIAASLQVNLTVAPMDRFPQVIRSPGPQTGSRPAKPLIQVLSEEDLVAYSCLPDLFGRPALVLRIELPRTIYAQGKWSMELALVTILVTGCIFTLVGVLATERWVLRRLRRLSTEVTAIGVARAAGRRVAAVGQDELADLGHKINDMLDALETAGCLLRGVAEATNTLLAEADFTTAVNQALAVLGKTARVDRAYVFQNHRHTEPGQLMASLQYEWCGESARSQRDHPLLQSMPYQRCPRWHERLSAGRPIVGRVADFPAPERAILAPQNTVSVVMVPIMIDGRFWGFIGFDDCRTARYWSDAEISILTVMASSVAGAIVRHRAESRLQHDSLHDALTGLPNRVFLHNRIEQCLRKSKEDPGHKFALLFLDLDRFKVINDSLGHVAGDQLLIKTARRLQGYLEQADGGRHTIARIGGDEFTIVLDGLRSPAEAEEIAEHIQVEVSRPFLFEGQEIFTTASIGIVSDTTRYAAAKDLLRDADTAMYHAKCDGKARHATFNAAMHHAVVTRLRVESDLRRAMERNELLLHYQPIVSLTNGRLMGFEALLRWQHEGRLISPLEFIPVAEDTGLIVPIGAWVLEETCAQLATWQAQHTDGSAIVMNVNLSRRQLAASGLINTLQKAVRRCGIAPSSLNLEITESLFLDNARTAESVLWQIRKLGFGLHIDDFGTGYSSLSCLHQFPLQAIKIDRTFIASVSERRDYAAVVHAIVTLARNLNMQVIAEGIETADQIAFLQAVDCDLGQGYYFAKPMPAEAAGRLLADRPLMIRTA